MFHLRSITQDLIENYTFDFIELIPFSVINSHKMQKILDIQILS